MSMFDIDSNASAGRKVRHIPTKRSGTIAKPVNGRDEVEVTFESGDEVVKIKELTIDLSGTTWVIG